MSSAIAPNPPRWQPNPDPNSINVPGLDTAASTLEQIEQIEQLITIKLQVRVILSSNLALIILLQNIDENFSKIHNVLANKILPAVKRYAVGTEPIREAAKAGQVLPFNTLPYLTLTSFGHHSTSKPPKFVYRHTMISLH
jgi:hypothetical protein